MKLTIVGALFLLLSAAAGWMADQYHVGFGVIVALVEFVIIAAAAQTWGIICCLPAWLRPKWAVNLWSAVFDVEDWPDFMTRYVFTGDDGDLGV